MKPHGVEIRKIATATGVVTLASFVAILLISGVELSDLIPAIARGTGALSAAAVFWVAYNRWLWRYRPFRLFGWLSPVPDLNGRWVGTVQRSRDDEPRPFVIEIVQTYTSIHFRTFSKNSSGESIAVSITKIEDSEIFGLIAAWRTKTRKIGSANEVETFRGVSHWRLEFTDLPGRQRDKIKIVDDYYTDRQTAGVVQATWVSRSLRNGYGLDD